MQIGIIGCGWLGERLGYYFLKKGYTVVTTNRTQKKANTLTEKGLNSFSVDFSTQYFDKKAQQKINKCNVLIISVSVRSELCVFKNIARFLKENTAQQILFFSTVGIYKNSCKEADENSPLTYLKSPFLEIESLLQSYFPTINILRLGGLLGDDRVFANYFKEQKEILNTPVNHIHYKDVGNSIEKMIQLQITGKTYNLVAPQHPTKNEVIKNQMTTYKIQAKMLSENKKLAFKIVTSEKLIRELDYTFLYPNPAQF